MSRRSKSKSRSKRSPARERKSKSRSKRTHASARVPAHAKKVPTSHHVQKPDIHVEKASGPVRLPSKASKSHTRERPTHANKEMSMTDLQYMAKSRGIQFGGLNKSQLVEKINRY